MEISLPRRELCRKLGLSFERMCSSMFVGRPQGEIIPGMDSVVCFNLPLFSNGQTYPP